LKQRILDFCIKSIKKDNPDKYSSDQLAEIKYGLEGVYLTITKMVIIVIVALLLGIFKEMIAVMLCYNLLRITGFGLHASKSWICLVSSLITFIGGTLLVIYLDIPLSIKPFICAFCIISFYLYAPADTKKHPLIKTKKRKIYKVVTVTISLIYTFLCLYLKDNFLSNLFLISMVIETILILPLTYKIFKLPYNNYKTYILNNN